MPGSKGSGSRLTASIIAGLVLVPVSAIAAVALVGAMGEAPAAETFDATATSSATTTTMVVEAVEASTDDDLDEDATRQACTIDAELLIERELDGSITDLEAAALDALRQICEDADMPIAGPPVPAPIVRTVTVSENQTTTTVPSGTSYDDDHGNDHDEDDDYDENDDHDEDDDYDDHDENDDHDEDDD